MKTTLSRHSSVVALDVHNIGLAVRTPTGALDSLDGDIWELLDGYWYVRNANRPLERVTVPAVLAALHAREAQP